MAVVIPLLAFVPPALGGAPAIRTIDADAEYSEDVTVAADEKLVIRPGVTLRFAPDAGIVSEGAVEAVGTEGEPIVFTAKDPAAGWANVYLKGPRTEGSAFSWCTFSHGRGRQYEFDLRQGLAVVRVMPPSSGEGSGCGGALFLYMTGHVKIERCRFVRNRASWGGGAISCWRASSPQIILSCFERNVAGEDAGAVHAVMKSHPTIAGNCFVANEAQYGGALHCLHFSHPSICGNYLTRNAASKSAGAISMFNACAPVISGNLIVDNSARRWGALGGARGVQPVLVGNCIVRNPDEQGDRNGLPPEFVEKTTCAESAIRICLGEQGIIKMASGAK
jgi:hypothetical protein